MLSQITNLCYKTIRFKSWVVLLCNKWSTLSSPAGSLNVLSRKYNKTSLSTFQSSPGRRKNCLYSPLLLHRQGRAAKWKHFFLLWKSSGRSSSSFPWFQGHFIKLGNTSIGWVCIAQGLSRVLDLQLLYCHTQIRSLAGSRSDTLINWDTWVGGIWETCRGVTGWGCNRRLVCLSLSPEMMSGPCQNFDFESMLLLLSAFFAIVCNIHFLHSSHTTDREINLRFWA